MKPPASPWLAGLARLSGRAGLLATLSGAAPAIAAGAGVVELPPMMVEESVSGVPWLYVKAGGTEFLSRCSASTTRNLVEAWLDRMQLMRVLLPDEFLAHMDVPAVFVIYGQDLKQTVSAEIQRELQAVRGGEASSGDRVNIAPNMRLVDRDLHASIAYIDESQFDAAALSIAPNHVRYLLRGRVPEPPGWLVEGVERVWQRTDFILDPITLAPLVWLNPTESEALAADPTRPRALLPASELFELDALRAAETPHRRRVEARASTQELFVRWALVSGEATRAALWKFAARAAEGPVSEEMFEDAFGFGYAELRDRLSDFLPRAVRAPARIRPGPRPPLPRIEVEAATPNEVARVRGEWERLAIGYVRRRLPEAREPYVAQARRTLRRAYDAGDRDPRLLATMGLCEIDAGDEAAARRYLEAAVAGGVARPRAYHELARLRYEELRREAAESRQFSFLELAPVFDVLRRGLAQAPPLPESYTLLAEAWARCELTPTPTEFAELETGARLFFRRPDVAYPIARTLVRHGRPAAAAVVLEVAAGHAADEEVRTGMARLRAELASSSPAGSAGAESAAGSAAPPTGGVLGR